MALAATKRWRSITLTDIAAAAELSLAELYSVAPDKHVLLRRALDQVNRQMLDEDYGFDDSLSVRDRLFDVLMTRFEALKDWRSGLECVSESRDPSALKVLFKNNKSALTWALELSGANRGRSGDSAQLAGLIALHDPVIRAFMRDETDDLSHTLRVLDEQLNKAQRWAEARQDWRQGRFTNPVEMSDVAATVSSAWKGFRSAVKAAGRAMNQGGNCTCRPGGCRFCRSSA